MHRRRAAGKADAVLVIDHCWPEADCRGRDEAGLCLRQRGRHLLRRQRGQPRRRQQGARVYYVRTSADGRSSGCWSQAWPS